jgi:hypothetical protein
MNPEKDSGQALNVKRSTFIRLRKGFGATRRRDEMARQRTEIPSPQSFAVYDNGVSSNSAPPKGRGGDASAVAKAMARQGEP